MEKTVTARKDYTCSYCGELIKKGTKHTFEKGRGGRYDKDDNQCGVEYYSCRFCIPLCDEQIDEQKEQA